MSRKHYRAMAAHIHALNERLSEDLPKSCSVKAQEHVLDFAQALAFEFKRDNGDFDRSKFLAACGYVVDMGGNVNLS